MPIIASEIQYRLSGGAANSTPITSLGGAKSSVAIPTGLFDDVTSAQAAAGLTEYRCIYVHNANATLVALGARIWIQANTVGTRIAIGVGASAVNGTETATANEAAVPAGVSFATTPVDLATSVLLGDIPAGQHRAVWLRRTIAPGAALATDTFTLRTQCDTNP